MREVWLILETSGRSRVGVAIGDDVCGTEDLGGTRQHNRHLIPTIDRLLRTHQLSPKHLTHIAVGIGPGSFTGLRVGVTAAKSLAYSLGCSLVAVPTFAAIAADVPGPVDVFADALRGMVYTQRFSDGRAESDLQIARYDDWVRTVGSVAGPGVGTFADQLPAQVRRSSVVEPTAAATWRVARTLRPLTREQVLRLEPLYVRASSAEENANRA